MAPQEPTNPAYNILLRTAQTTALCCNCNCSLSDPTENTIPRLLITGSSLATAGFLLVLFLESDDGEDVHPTRRLALKRNTLRYVLEAGLRDSDCKHTVVVEFESWSGNPYVYNSQLPS
jgi:hypothetical protein